jgi:murein DD-endopeptidase MepM/ murein hydrolase activator NlpD
MRESDAERILRTELSHTLYTHNRLPVAVLVYSEDSAEQILPSGGEWLLRKPDNVFIPSTIPSQTADSNAARAFQSRPFDIRFNIEPDILLLEVTDDKEIVFSGILSNFNENFYRDEMRDLQIVLTAEWREKEENDFRGTAVYVLDVKYFVPAKFEISRLEAIPGDVVAITAYNMSEHETLSVTTDMGYEISFGTVGNNRIALIPIGNNENFAGRTFNLTLTSDVNEPIDYFLQINERAQQSWNMGAQDSFVAAHLSAGALDTRRSRYNDILAVASEPGTNHWTERFIMPGNGRLLLEYGWRVTVNTGHAQIYNGVKIEVSAGDSVIASNGGRVVFAGEVPYDGNLVVIDHGMGIKTWYGHLGSIDVRAGEGVLKGQQIGTGGRTGMATGISLNYLFYAMSVGNVFVDPVPVINDGIPGIEAITSDRAGFDAGIFEAADSSGVESENQESQENQEEPDEPEAAWDTQE